MTNNGKSNQGEGSVGGFCRPHALQPMHYEQSLLTPLMCAKVELVVHQRAGGDAYCFAIEVSDPHTGELVAKHVDPARRYSPVTPMPVQVSLTARALLLGAFDPDPF